MTTSEMNDIASKSLGDSTSYAIFTDKYDETLLNPMPRSIARNENNITDEDFLGYDVWHCYEATFLTDTGHPVSGILKIVYPSDTEYMIESKSMKLFLNSFDMCKMGLSLNTAMNNYVSTVRAAISKCLGDDRVNVCFFRHTDILAEPDKIVENPLLNDARVYDAFNTQKLDDISNLYDSDASTSYIEFNKNSVVAGRSHTVLFESLRSRCRHTKQKDTGIAIVKILGTNISDESIYKQVTALRETNEFHEFCSERLFTHIYNYDTNNSIIVSLLYTRRGSLDINPIRYNKNISNKLFNEYIADFVNANKLTIASIVQ